MKVRCITAAIFTMAASFVLAQVEVEDRVIPSVNSSAASPPSGQQMAELYYQLQLLQQEVLQLRGMVEEQNHELKKLKQQRLDDYVDLDRRLSTRASEGSSSDSSAAVTSSRGGSALAADSAGEMDDYKSAMNLVLREQKYDEAVDALKQHLQQYPSGRFAANAKYWLGEVYLQKKALPEAEIWFGKVMAEHPEHTKAPDAQYKLGIVYHKLGDVDKATRELQAVAQSSANAAKLAQDYLDTQIP